MADLSLSLSVVSSSGTASVRQRTSTMLMMVRLRAAEGTMERSLARLKARIAETTHLLKRLGADTVEAGEPLFDEQKEKNPMARLHAEASRAIAARRKSQDDDDTSDRGINAVVTGMWSIAGLSP